MGDTTQTDDASDPAAPDDPVLARRHQMARWATAGKRLGYLLFGLAMVLFAVAMLTGLPRGLAMAVIASMAVGSLVLAPSIVIGYGVKAADREDRERAGHT